jgi:hypothetical protein
MFLRNITTLTRTGGGAVAVFQKRIVAGLTAGGVKQ